MPDTIVSCSVDRVLVGPRENRTNRECGIVTCHQSSEVCERAAVCTSIVALRVMPYTAYSPDAWSNLLAVVGHAE